MNFYIKSYGCQMNFYDSQKIEDMLLQDGHQKAETPEEANLLIFNTCSIREKADDKLFSDLGRAKLLKNQHKDDNFIIVVAGCVAQSRPQDVIERHPYVDLICGPQEIQNISKKIKESLNHTEISPRVLANFNTAEKFEIFKNQKLVRKNVSEYLTIQEGCNNFCTYCVVPYTRGREFSRNVEEIVEEAKQLVDCGVKEITLLGQNVNSYKGTYADGHTCRLAELFWKLSEIPGLKRLRYSSSHPKDIDEEIAKAHRDISILMPSLHLPVQSGSNSVLKRMNRNYTKEKYLEVIAMLREYRPDMAFSSDFIVGFPGETDKDFEDTLDLVKQVRFSMSYSFKYNPRPHTPAAKMEDQIDEKIKSERLQILQNLLNQQQTEFNEKARGATLQVLFEKPGRHEHQLVGRSEYFQSVSVKSENIKIGDCANVLITDIATHSLIGEIV